MTDSSTPITPRLWGAIVPIYRRILAHPFIKGLQDGSLPVQAFRFYVVQDWRYLQDFSRCLAMASFKAPQTEWCMLFAERAKSALVVEHTLHEGFFHDWGISPDAISQIGVSPTTLAYTSFLYRVAAVAPFEELVGALLPCYWIYWEVGKALQAQGSPHPLYQRWIDTYASAEFGASVRDVLAALDGASADLPEGRRDRILANVLTAARYEWMFWDAAWRQEPWPV